jgi:hypothetical protein
MVGRSVVKCALGTEAYLMMRKWRVKIIGGIIVLSGGITALVLFRREFTKRPAISLNGAVISDSADPTREQPIAGVQITATAGLVANDGKSDSSGLFHISVPQGRRPVRRVQLQFHHPGYRLLDVNVPVGNELYVIRMTPNRHETQSDSKQPPVKISNVTIRYTVKATTALIVGSKVKSFQVVNRGNLPCHGSQYCSPDGHWKAGIGSALLDAGEGNVFRNVQVFCIAGPCPFTRINSNGFSNGGRRIMVSALDWSDTATFLVEADVFHPMVSDDVRISYPFEYVQALSFAVPASAEGVCLEADLNGNAIVFPLGPDLLLNWASCVPPVTQGQTRVYRCELKPGYQFQ